jgi:DNA-binding transcriptional MerR regulator
MFFAVDWGQWLAFGGAFIAIASAIIVGVSWGRGSTLKATNEMLEKALGQEREQLAAVEARCDEKIADLERQIATLTKRLAGGE